MNDAIFSRSELLLGQEAMSCIARKRIIIFGFMLAGLVLQDACKTGEK